MTALWHLKQNQAVETNPAVKGKQSQLNLCQSGFFRTKFAPIAVYCWSKTILPSNCLQPGSAELLLPPPGCRDWSTPTAGWGRAWLLLGATASEPLWVDPQCLGRAPRRPTVEEKRQVRLRLTQKPMLVKPVQVSQNENSRVLEAQSDFIFTFFF